MIKYIFCYRTLKTALATMIIWTLALTNPAFSSIIEQGSTTGKLTAAAGLISLAEIPPPLDIALRDVNGNPLQLSDYLGQVVMLNFWTTWCPNCEEETKAFEKLHRRLKPDGFTLLTVNLKEPNKTVKRFMGRNKLTFPVLMDRKGDVSRHFKVRALPTTYLLNKKGALIGLAIGPRNWNGKALAALLAHLISAP